MNEHEKALPAGGPAKPTQNAVKIYVISSRERLLLPLAFCFCLLLVNTLLWSGPTAGLTAAVCVWYGLLGLYLGRTLLNTWESRVLLAVNLALAATLALGSNWYFRAWNLLALLALLPVHAIGLSGGQFLPWWRPSMLWERLCLLLWGLFGHLGAALATAWPQKKDGAARRVLPLLLGASRKSVIGNALELPVEEPRARWSCWRCWCRCWPPPTRCSPPPRRTCGPLSPSTSRTRSGRPCWPAS